MKRLLLAALAAVATTAGAQWPAYVTKSSAAGGITVGDTIGGTCAEGSVLYSATSQALACASTLSINSTAGQGPSVAAGTATTDVAAFSVVRTNNNAAVATGVKFAFTDTTSAAGFLPFQVLGGASATANLLKVPKAGGVLVPAGSSGSPTIGWDGGGRGIYMGNSGLVFVTDAGNPYFAPEASALGVQVPSGGIYGFSSTTSAAAAPDVVVSRIAAGVAGVGLTASGQVTGTFAATNYRVASKAVILGTAPTIASGGCTSPTVTNTNGTAYITIDVGTSCSGSQPVVFTLPAATTGWNCYARNISNGATSTPAQTGAVSTTSVTITNFARTTGIAAAWTDGDDVVVSCLGG